MTDGFLRVASVAPLHRIADVDYNVDQIIESIQQLENEGVEIAVFPELCITGYSCGDLFHNATLLEGARKGLDRIAKACATLTIHPIVGVPLRDELSGALYNCAVLIRGGNVDIVRKQYLPSYNEFYERRWFAPDAGLTPVVFESHGVRIAIEICEDLWVPLPPSTIATLHGAQVVFNLSASNDLIGKYDYLRSLIRQQSARCLCAYAYASAGFGESSTDMTFLPKTLIAECGTILAENDRMRFLDGATVIADIDIEAIDRDRLHTTTFSDCSEREHTGITVSPDPTDSQFVCTASPLKYRNVSPRPFVPADGSMLNDRCAEIAAIQQSALARRLRAVGSNKITVGISGGLDSTLALLVAVDTVKRLGGEPSDVTGVTMPGFGTTDRTYDNALQLMRRLGVTIEEIPIAKAVNQHFADIKHNPANHDVTYENSQARERTQILMDIANRDGAIVLGTGDLSELALGWCTYNGDHMSMYGVNTGVPKTLVRHLVKWYATNTSDKTLHDTLTDIIATPISPELTPADEHGDIRQKTEDLVGPYELHDFFLYYMLRYGFSPAKVFLLAEKAFIGQYDSATIKKWLKTFYRRFFNQQFKRSCLPDGPKVGSVCLSPRGDWRMPSDATSALWLKEIDNL